MICKRVFLIVLLGMTGACARNVDVRAPEVIHTERFSYLQDEQGRWLIVARTAKDLDEAVRYIHPGPASLEKVDLWVITPLDPVKR